jgi:hypothetical protein
MTDYIGWFMGLWVLVTALRFMRGVLASWI